MPAKRVRASAPPDAATPPPELEYAAQLATLMAATPSGDDWLHEQKFDGYRIGLRKDGGTVSLWSRRGNDWTVEFRAIAEAGAHLKARQALLDGEVAVLLPSGVTSFQSLQNRKPRTPLVYFAFDLLALDGEDLRALPIETRKARLRELLSGSGVPDALRSSDHAIGNGGPFFAQACKLGLEGAVSKRLGTPYRPGRNGEWVKTKCLRRQEFVIGGYTDPEGSREGVGSLLLGVYDDGRLRRVGKVGTGPGWTGSYLRSLRQRLETVAAVESPFAPPVADSSLPRHAHWVRPELVAEAAFGEWTNDGHIRHPSMQGLRRTHLPRTSAPRSQFLPPHPRSSAETPASTRLLWCPRWRAWPSATPRGWSFPILPRRH